MSISYVTTIYNKAHFLGGVLAALEHEWSETGGEIILIDDGSTDGSLGILKEFARSRTYAIVHHQENSGVASATNAGFLLARQPFVRFVDGDDILSLGSTKRLLQAVEDLKVGFAYGRFGHYEVGTAQPLQTNSTASPQKIDDPLRLMLTSQPFIPSNSLAVRKVVAAAFPLPEHYPTSQDFCMGLRFARLTAFAKLNEICCLVPLVAANRLSSSKACMFADTANLMAEHLEEGEAWPAAHVRYGVRRTAGRAYRYAHRHLNCTKWQMLWLRSVKIASYLPFLSFSPSILRQIARIYDEALADPKRYP